MSSPFAQYANLTILFQVPNGTNAINALGNPNHRHPNVDRCGLGEPTAAASTTRQGAASRWGTVGALLQRVLGPATPESASGVVSGTNGQSLRVASRSRLIPAP